MLLYRPSTRPPLSDFGIRIPVAPNKTGQIMNVLRSHPVLGPREKDWLFGRDETTITREDVLRVHSPEYVARLYGPQLHEILLNVYELLDEEGHPDRYKPELAVRPLTEMFDGTLGGVAGTYQCCRIALEKGYCFYLGGGAHHAHRDFGHGFCIVNDSAIALRRLQAEGHIRTAWVIDVDAHKGDGTAGIMHGDDSIITLSVHMANGWPLDGPSRDPQGKLNPAFVPSDIDVPMAKGEDEEYLPRLEKALARLADYPRADLGLVLAGADPYELDELPSTQDLRLTLEQMTERNRLIDRFLADRGIPRAFLMAGGYGAHAWEVYPPFLIETLLAGLEP
jgi:acetoin utilization deacetylase AcuC-like enzyme